MIVRSTTARGVQRLRFEGEDSLHFGCAAKVRRQLARLVREDRDVVLDLSTVGFVDSAGLGVLVGLYKTTHAAGRKLLLAGVTPEVREVMRVVRLDQIFAFADDVGDAVDRLSAVV